jgi:hypothetical protein
MYLIYEIVGVKVGCTRSDRFEKRQRAQQDKGQMIILEEYEDIYVASNREYELQREKGYKIDPRRYHETVALSSLGGKAGNFAGRQKGGLKGGITTGRKNVESGHLKRLNAMQVKCPWCDRLFNPPGLGNHKKACKSKP